MGDSELPNDVLLVEDNLIIAIDTEMLLGEIGVANVRSVSSVAAALAAIAQALPDFAVIDVNLGDGSGYDVAAVLLERDVPFVFATGYAQLMSPPPKLSKATIITKPYSRESLLVALRRAT